MITRALIVVLLACPAVWGCGGTESAEPEPSADAGAPNGSAGSQAQMPDGTGIVGSAARAKLAKLSAAKLPAPAEDVSNRYADDPAAAALGQRFFFDRGFSGALLDSDNTGAAGTLGSVGDSGKVACSDCHEPSLGFVDKRSPRQQVSLGSGWGRRRAPSLLNVGQATLLMWDGRRDTSYNQPIAALESGLEMNSSRLYLAQQINARYRESYNAVFKDDPISVPLDDASRFPQLDGSATGCRELTFDKDGISSTSDCHGAPGDGAEYDGMSAADQDAVTRIAVNFGKAIAAYLRLLTCGAGRFDQWMAGRDDALSASEQRGAALFVGQREGGEMVDGCDTCHSGPFMSDQKFHNVGMMPMGVGIAASFYDREDHGARDGLMAALTDPLNVRGKYSDGDDGRLPAEVTAAMDGAFRTPMLRCVSVRPTLMHNGQLASLEDVLEFFDRGGDASGFHGTNELQPLGLSAADRADLVAFLKALDGPGPADELLAAPAP